MNNELSFSKALQKLAKITNKYTVYTVYLTAKSDKLPKFATLQLITT